MNPKPLPFYEGSTPVAIDGNGQPIYPDMFIFVSPTGEFFYEVDLSSSLFDYLLEKAGFQFLKAKDYAFEVAERSE